MKNQTKRVDDAVAASRENKKKRPRIEDRKKEQRSNDQIERERLMRVDTDVWDFLRRHKAEIAKAEAAREGNPLDLPFKTGRERLAYNKQKYAGMTLVQAFADLGGHPIDPEIDINLGNETPTELHIGDVINLNITSISKKNGVTFNSGCYKENFATRNNFAHFDKFSKVLPIEPVKAQVVEIGPKQTVVDVFTPLINDFILPRAAQPWIQNLVNEQALTVEVVDLHLVRGGYVGKAIIPTISEFVGQPFMVDAFIPGSQIVLNTTDDFEAFEGQDVKTFIMSYAPKPGNRGMSLVCSRKNYLKHCGNMLLRQLHSMWCDAGKEWETISQQDYQGKVTGVINSAKKCGVFVEIPELNVTGMIHTQPDELVYYKAGDEFPVRIKEFDEELVFNPNVGQMQHLPAFEIENGAIKKVNIKPILEQVMYDVIVDEEERNQ